MNLDSAVAPAHGTREARCLLVPRAVFLAAVSVVGAARAADHEPAGLPQGPDSSSAQSGSEPSVILEVDSWLATPRNLDLDYAFIDETGGLSGGGRTVTLAPGHDWLPRLRAAWQIGAEGAPQIGTTVWELEASSTSASGFHPMMVGALLASPDFAIGRSLVDSGLAQTRVRATQIDADLRWRFAPGDRSRIGLSAGLRLFRFEQQTTVTYDAERFGERLQEIINVSTDASGIGPHVGFSFGYRIGGRVWFGGEAGFALPVGDLAGTATDTAFRDPDGDGILDVDRATVVERSGTRRSFPQLDGAIRVDVRIVDRLEAFATYQFVQWPGVTVTQRFVDDVSQNTTLPIEGDAVFEGASAGLRFRF